MELFSSCLRLDGILVNVISINMSKYNLCNRTQEEKEEEWCYRCCGTYSDLNKYVLMLIYAPVRYIYVCNGINSVMRLFQHFNFIAFFKIFV